MDPVYRPARSDDVADLFDIRRQSILELAPQGMSVAEVVRWAQQLTLAGMAQKLRELEIWIAELDGVPVGWGAIHGGRLEGLYVAPQFVRRGVGAGLLVRLEGLMRERGVRLVQAEASSNARDFYLRRGYRLTGVQASDAAWPIEKDLQ
jgi:putative acetyltransferase